MLQDPPGAEQLPLVRLAVDLHEVAGARIHRQPRLRREVRVVPVDQVVHQREAPALRELEPTPLELAGVALLRGELVPRGGELLRVPVELDLDRAQAPHPQRRAAEPADRRVGVGPPVAQPLLERPPLHRAHRQLRREHAPLLAVARRLRTDRPLAHQLLDLPRIHTG